MVPVKTIVPYVAYADCWFSHTAAQMICWHRFICHQILEMLIVFFLALFKTEILVYHHIAHFDVINPIIMISVLNFVVYLVLV